jgi:hypothetical protein
MDPFPEIRNRPKRSLLLRSPPKEDRLLQTRRHCFWTCSIRLSERVYINGTVQRPTHASFFRFQCLAFEAGLEEIRRATGAALDKVSRRHGRLDQQLELTGVATGPPAPQITKRRRLQPWMTEPFALCRLANVVEPASPGESTTSIAADIVRRGGCSCCRKIRLLTFSC